MKIAALIPIHKCPIPVICKTIASAAIPGIDCITIANDSGPHSDADIVEWLKRFELWHAGLGGIRGPANDWPIKFVRTPKNLGPGGARDYGVTHTDADYIATLDVGDYWYPEAKARQLAFVRETQPQACFSRCFDTIAGAERPLHAEWAERIFTSNRFQLSTTVYRKDVWARVGGYPPSWWASDWLFNVVVQKFAGWTMYDECTGTADEGPGGHSDVHGDLEKCRQWRECVADAQLFARSVSRGEWLPPSVEDRWKADPIMFAIAERKVTA